MTVSETRRSVPLSQERVSEVFNMRSPTGRLPAWHILRQILKDSGKVGRVCRGARYSCRVGEGLLLTVLSTTH